MIIIENTDKHRRLRLRGARQRNPLAAVLYFAAGIFVTLLTFALIIITA